MSSRIPHLNGLLARSKLLNRVALTPEGIPLREAVEALKLLIGEGAPLISISFHSPSVEPGHTPYVRDQADLAQFFAWWDGVLTTLASAGVKPISVEDVLEVACSTLRADTPHAHA